MPYSQTFIDHVKKQPLTLGTRLARWLIRVDLPVQKASVAIGATRQSVYNWMKGGEVSPAYRERVAKVIEIIAKAPASSTTEYIWSLLCKEFNLNP